MSLLIDISNFRSLTLPMAKFTKVNFERKLERKWFVRECIDSMCVCT